LYGALGYAPPVFAHHSLLVGPDRQKLSKRHGATSVREFRERGVLPEALTNYLAFLGGGLEGGEVFSPDELPSVWDLSRTGKAAAVFDEKKLGWFNQQHIRSLKPAELTERLLPLWKSADLLEGLTLVEDATSTVRIVPPSDSDTWRVLTSKDVNLVSDAIAPMLHFLDDGIDLARPFFQAPEEVILPAAARLVIEGVKEKLAQASGLTPAEAKAMILDVGGEIGLKGRALFHPLRLALTDRERGPELDVIVSVLGPDECRRRLAAVSFEE
jgi:glutamyl/glutaminyl-tRNA synthetase